MGDTAVATIRGTDKDAMAHYLHTDHLTGSDIVSSDTASIDEVTDYAPFGDMRINEQAGDFAEKRKYTGHEYDADTGLTYANARYYDAKIGRWLSEDPVFLLFGDSDQIKQITGQELQQYLSDPQNYNSYAYARNNPLRYNDPTGQSSFNPLGFLSNDTQVRIGNWANNLHANNAAARYLMDHPYQAGAAIGVAAGAVAAGGVVAAGGAITCGALCGSAATIATTGGAVVNQSDKLKTTAEQGTKLINGPINITSEGLKHVLDAHTLEGVSSKGKSIFISGENIANLVRQGTQQAVEKQFFGSNFQRVFDVGRNIGIDRITNQKTSVMTIITDKAGKLITAFPGRP